MNKRKELPIEFWEKERPKANKYKEALDVFEEYVSFLDGHKLLEKYKLDYLYSKLDLLKELIVVEEVLSDLYYEYVINKNGDKLTKGAKQLACTLTDIKTAIDISLYYNRSNNDEKKD